LHDTEDTEETDSDLAMGKIIGCRVLRRAGQRKNNQFVSKLYGQGQLPHGGRYHYRIRGLLDQRPYVMLIRRVLIIRPEDEEKLVKFLHRYEAEYNCRDIVLMPQDREALTQNHRRSNSVPQPRYVMQISLLLWLWPPFLLVLLLLSQPSIGARG